MTSRDRVVLAPGVRLDPDNAHRLARAARAEVGRQDAEAERTSRFPARPLPRKPGVGAERIAKDRLRRVAGWGLLHHRYDAGNALLNVLVVTSMGDLAPQKYRDCAALGLSQFACAMTSPSEHHYTLLVVTDHAAARALERLSIPGPRDVVRGVPVQWILALRQARKSGAPDVVLPLVGGQRPGALRCKWSAGTDVLVAITAIDFRSGSAAENRCAEIETLIASTPPPKLGEIMLTPAQEEVVRLWVEISNRTIALDSRP